MTNNSTSLQGKVLELSNLVKDINIPIQLSAHHNQEYFTIPVSLDNMEYRVYINTDAHSHTPPDRFIWDYFASSELYFSLPQNLKIKSVKSSFVFLFHTFLLKNSILSNHPEASNKSYGIDFDLINPAATTVVSSVVSPTSPGVFAWSFDLHTFFNLEEVKNSTSTQSPDPICKYFTIKNTFLDITSKEYAFANRPDNIPICSSPNLTEPNQISFCSFFALNAKQSSCSFYSYDSFIVLSNKITPKNSSNDFSITLHYSTAIDSSHIFKIINDSDSTEISSFSYPSHYSYEDILSQAISVYEEYINCYQDHDLLENTISKESNTETKLSYIETLIGI